MVDNKGESTRRRPRAAKDGNSNAVEREGAETAGARIAKWLGGLVSLLLIVGVVYWVYQLGRRDANDVPVIQALGGVAREQPAEPGGEQASHQGLQVNEVLAGNETAALGEQTTLAPPPQRVVEQDNPVELEAVTTPDAEPAATGDTPIVFDRPEGLIGDPTMTRPERRVPVQGLSPNADLLSNAIADAIAEEAGGGPAPVGNTAPVTSIAAGTVLIQFDVYDDEASAIRDWDVFVESHRDLIGSLTRYIERREAGGRVFYRLRAMGFDDMAHAENLCKALVLRDVPCITARAR